MYYSQSTTGFYDPAIHDCIPADAVEISAAEHTALINGQSTGKRIVSDADGYPVLADPPLPTLAELVASKNDEINAWRAAANAGTFTFGGKTFSCDQLSRSDIDGVNGEVALTGALPRSFPGAWKAADNSFLVLADVAAWTAFYRAMVAQGAVNFARALELKAQLATATTPEEVAAIVW